MKFRLDEFAERVYRVHAETFDRRIKTPSVHLRTLVPTAPLTRMSLGLGSHIGPERSELKHQLQVRRVRGACSSFMLRRTIYAKKHKCAFTFLASRLLFTASSIAAMTASSGFSSFSVETPLQSLSPPCPCSLRLAAVVPGSCGR